MWVPGVGAWGLLAGVPVGRDANRAVVLHRAVHNLGIFRQDASAYPTPGEVSFGIGMKLSDGHATIGHHYSPMFGHAAHDATRAVVQIPDGDAVHVINVRRMTGLSKQISDGGLQKPTVL